ncbi:hypothetical protein F2P81_010331 [Scophthalmus maximus]|uniref:Uncharacterized protein n=1 Tax=Scophthalmus maximus TaxID=52904 RepID=A0A6A4SVE1_SCOMX|nr:hypothetical protein F2P81_010331 [Scophthalmus maximus]
MVLPEDFYSIFDDMQELSTRSDACISPEVTTDLTENKLDPHQTKAEFRAFSPGTSDIESDEFLLEDICPDQTASSPVSISSINECGSPDRDEGNPPSPLLTSSPYNKVCSKEVDQGWYEASTCTTGEEKAPLLTTTVSDETHVTHSNVKGISSENGDRLKPQSSEYMPSPVERPTYILKFEDEMTQKFSHPLYLDLCIENTCSINNCIFRSLHVSYDVELSRHRSFTPESMLSDWDDTGLNLDTLFEETRPESPQSNWLSDVRASSPESSASVEQHLSDVEYSTFCLEELFGDNRPDSPDSLTLWDKEGIRSSVDDCIAELRPQSPESVVSQSELRPLSPDSPVPQFRSLHNWLSDVRASSPESAASVEQHLSDVDVKYQAEDSCGVKSFELRSVCLPSISSDKEGIRSSVDDCIAELRPQSPESVVSQSELRPLSPDSPVPQFRSLHVSYDVELSRHRSFTPESMLSDWEDTGLYLDTLFEETRPESPLSVLSDSEIDKLFSSRALSPESVSADFDFSLFQNWLSDVRASSPESAASVEQHCLSPWITFGQMKNQHCNYYLEYSENRPVSPLSTVSDVEYSTFCLEELFGDNRPDSPDSLTLWGQTNCTNIMATTSPPLSAGRPLTYADVVRGCSVKYQAEDSCGVKSFELRSVCLPSISSDKEGIRSSVDDCIAELRPQSPESVVSQSELRPLSPDSPVPQFRSLHVSYDVELSRHRSFTPESMLSDWEDTGLYLDTLFEETRPESPLSVLSDSEIDKLFSSRALSPESVSTDFDFSLFQNWLSDVRASSPESAASVEQHCLSPWITFGQMKNQHCNYYLEYSENRPVSPLSTVSDVEYSTFCLEELFGDNRPDSPDSLTLWGQTNCTNIMATTSPPLSAGRPLTYADVVRGCSVKYQAEDSCGVKSFELRSVCLPSISSDKEGIRSSVDDCIAELRPQSPESVVSQSELRPLSPDSPVPQFRSLHVSYDVELSRHRSFTPESMLSDWDDTGLNLDTLFEETRPESPQSVLSDFEIDKLFSSRALSPESVSTDFDFSLFQNWLSDVRASSPESSASVEQHCLSPWITFGQMKNQHCNYYLEYSENRPVSPLSTVSDVEYSTFCLEELFGDNRPDSPDSLTLWGQTNCTNIMATTSPPLSAGRPLTYADVVRGCSVKYQAEDSCGVKSFELRSVCLPSISSDKEGIRSSVDDCIAELRPQSPESVVSQSELRPLSPDSPVPQFRSLHVSYNVELSRHRSFTPESMLSDWEDTGLYLDPLFEETRPESPQSVSSDSEIDKLSSSRALSPESVSSNYDFSLFQNWLSDVRASSPESAASVEQHCLSPWITFGQMKNQHYKEGIRSSVDDCIAELRPQSPESVVSQSELRPLSPDSPVPQFRSLHNWLSDVRASSPESAASVEQHCLSPWITFGQMKNQHYKEGIRSSVDDCIAELRPQSPESVVSQSELRPLSPDSPVPQFRSLHVSTTSFKTNLSESSKQKNVDLGHCQVFPTEMPPSSNDSVTLSTQKLELSIPGSVTQDSLCQRAEDSPDKILMPSESTPTPPGSGSPQLDQLLSDLEEMKFKFRPEALGSPLSDYSDISAKVDQSLNQKFEDLSPEDPCHTNDSYTTSGQDEPELVSITDLTNTSETIVPSNLCRAAKCPSDVPENYLADQFEEDSTTDIFQGKEKRESTTPCNVSRDVTEEISTESSHLWEVISVEAFQTEDLSSQSLSDLTPETVTSARHFSFDELNPYSSLNFDASSEEDGPRTSGQYSEESLVDHECFTPQPNSVEPKAERTSSSADEECGIIPGYEDMYTHMPPGYAEVVHSGAESPTFEYSDPEPYFDCNQGVSDFSEPDEPGSTTKSSGGLDYLSHSRVLEKVNRGVLLSSGSEDYEDAPFVHEPLHKVQEESEESIHYSEVSDDEFTLCEASQLPPACEIGTYDDTDNSLTREITAELGTMSESSDEEFLTTRIVRRRVVIQADELPDLPTQSVTEEQYKDESGHIVVKKVTRKIIRKCVSADGVEREEVSVEGAPQGSVSVAEGDRYSKVVKRTVLKSEGDHSEVTFAEGEGFSVSRQETAEGSKALGYISGFSRAELPHVVERETIKEDGTVVRRAHMRKGRTLRRTVVKGAGQRKRVLLEQVDSPRKGTKLCGLQQHLHQLFHQYHKEDEEDTDEDGVEEEE